MYNREINVIVTGDVQNSFFLAKAENTKNKGIQPINSLSYKIISPSDRNIVLLPEFTREPK